MSKDEAGLIEAGLIEAGPLLQTLGDADAAVCTDGFCAVPPAPADQADTAQAGAGE